ncbi:MAG: DUF1887 family protein [gamma proteobacterium endosymbiont of Lamellibrachia anaximandri]|nr:DUF1887 family protein [gamma proteobacterium endosymbiont of Lamellibrachia anaximandri]MBL3535487.1 DUF1887 family protein [gamma proteobacterium endosymbiont of Lamellibrachia anaximandri]
MPEKNSTAHVCLVSAQPIPNLTPLFDPTMAPSRVVLVVSPDMRRHANWLEKIIRPRGIQVERWPIDDPWDIEAVQEQMLLLLEQETPQQTQLILNATGGTKPMSIAAYEAFRAYGFPIFYVHPEQDRVVWLHPHDHPVFNLPDRIRLESLLMAHGAVVEGKLQRGPVHSVLLETAEDLVRDITQLQQPLKNLNWLAYNAEKEGRRSVTLDSRQQADGRLMSLIDLFNKANVMHLKGGELIFNGEDARFFVNGGWFELYVYEQARQLRPSGKPLQDIGRGVVVKREIRGQRVPNELDVAFLQDNRLYLIECKTRQWAGRKGDRPGANAIYKLDTLKDLLGGLQARAMLVSYQDMPDHDRRRAADLGIKVCAGRDVQRLNEFLKQWIN